VSTRSRAELVVERLRAVVHHELGTGTCLTSPFTAGAVLSGSLTYKRCFTERPTSQSGRLRT
jgi:hypothetical protein